MKEVKVNVSAPRYVRRVMVAIVALIVGVAVVQNVQERDVEDSPLLTVDAIAFNGLLTAQVVGPGGDGRFEGATYWLAVVQSISYNRGEFYSSSAGGMVEQPLPAVGEEFVVEVMGELSLETNGTYLFYLNRPTIFDPQEQARWSWQALLVLEASPPYAPVNGTRAAMIESLDAIRLDGESTKDALIAFAQEQAAFLDATRAGQSPASPPRLVALKASRSAPSDVSDVTAWMERVAQRPATGRQLPGDLADVAEIDGAGYMAAFGVDAWTPWRIVILLDDELIGENEWMAVLVDGAGFFGPYGVTRGERILENQGYGPTGGTISLMTWQRGVPAEIAAINDSGTVAAKVRQLGTLRMALGDALGGEPDPAGISVIVDLRNGRSVVTQSDDKGITDLLSVEVVPSPPGSELDQ